MFLSIQCTPRVSAGPFTDLSSASHFVFRNECVSISFKKRAAYPCSYCHISADGQSINFGYAENISDISHDFLHGTINTSGELQLQRDALATLPIFYAQSKGILYIANSYSGVMNELADISLRQEALFEILDGKYFTPPLNEISYLGPYQHLKMAADGLTVSTASQTLLDISARAAPSDPHDFSRVLSDYLDYFIATRVTSRTCYEVSGGLDSALLPQYISLKNQKPLHLATLRFHDPHFGASQQVKLSELAQKTQAISHEIILDTQLHSPLKRHIEAPETGLPFLEGPYHAAVCALLDQMKDQGFDTICTGQGGDEFFGNFVASGEIVLGMPLSVQKTKLTNNAYIERDLWPLSPFMDPRLFAWAQGLPAHFRHDRKIMTAFHKAHGFAESIYNPALNENFGTFIIDCMVSGQYDAAVRDFARHSKLRARGITDPQKYVSLYHKIQSETYDETTKADDATEIYSWLLAEITARFDRATSA